MRRRGTPSQRSSCRARPPISVPASTTSRKRGRGPLVVSSHHERRKGDDSGRRSTSASHAGAQAPSSDRTSTVGIVSSFIVLLPEVPESAWRGGMGTARTPEGVAASASTSSHLDGTGCASSTTWVLTASRGVVMMLTSQTNNDRSTGPMSSACHPPDVAVILPDLHASHLGQLPATAYGQTRLPAAVMIVLGDVLDAGTA
jgi:hypothetical protein